jgi:hypothetical protein
MALRAVVLLGRQPWKYDAQLQSRAASRPTSSLPSLQSAIGFFHYSRRGLSELFLLVVFKSTTPRPHDLESADPLTRQHSLPRFIRLKSSSPTMLARSCLRSTRILNGARNGASSFAKVRPRLDRHPTVRRWPSRVLRTPTSISMAFSRLSFHRDSANMTLHSSDPLRRRALAPLPRPLPV